MTDEKRKALEADGWRVGDAGDFLGLTETHPASVRLELGVTPEFDELLSSLASELKGTKGDAILKGLALLQIALEARREGKRLVVVDDKENTEEDVDEV